MPFPPVARARHLREQRSAPPVPPAPPEVSHAANANTAETLSSRESAAVKNFFIFAPRPSTVFVKKGSSPILFGRVAVRCLFPLVHHLHEPLHHIRVGMGEEGGLLLIERGDLFHVIG